MPGALGFEEVCCPTVVAVFGITEHSAGNALAEKAKFSTAARTQQRLTPSMARLLGKAGVRSSRRDTDSRRPPSYATRVWGGRTRGDGRCEGGGAGGTTTKFYSKASAARLPSLGATALLSTPHIGPVSAKSCCRTRKSRLMDWPISPPFVCLRSSCSMRIPPLPLPLPQNSVIGYDRRWGCCPISFCYANPLAVIPKAAEDIKGPALVPRSTGENAGRVSPIFLRQTRIPPWAGDSSRDAFRTFHGMAPSGYAVAGDE